MLDDLAFDRRRGAFGGFARTLPPEAPLAMPPQVIEWGRAGRRRALVQGGWLRRLLFPAR